MSDTVSYDYTGGASTVYSVANQGGLTVLYRVIDVPTVIAAAAAEKAAGTATGLTSDTLITAAESISVFTLPIGFLIGGTVCYIKTAGTAGGTIDIGVPEGETVFDAGIDTATAGVWHASATDAGSMEAANGTMVDSRATDYDTVIVQFNANETVGRFVVAVWGIDFSPMLDLAVNAV
jgi:hypothetical protein